MSNATDKKDNSTQKVSAEKKANPAMLIKTPKLPTKIVYSAEDIPEKSDKQEK